MGRRYTSLLAIFLRCPGTEIYMEHYIFSFGNWTDLLSDIFVCLFVLITLCSVQSLSCVRLFVTPWTAARQASLSITNSQSLLKLMTIESVMPSNHLILCHPLLLLIRVFSNESALHIRWPKDWTFSFSIGPSNEHSGLISFRMDWLDLLAVQSSYIESALCI